jgi:hypothetical protein
MLESHPYVIEARIAEIRRDVMAAKLAAVVREILAETPDRRPRAENLHALFMAYRSQVV